MDGLRAVPGVDEPSVGVPKAAEARQQGVPLATRRVPDPRCVRPLTIEIGRWDRATCISVAPVLGDGMLNGNQNNRMLLTS